MREDIAGPQGASSRPGFAAALRRPPPRTRNERLGYAHRSSGRRVATAPRLAAAWRA